VANYHIPTQVQRIHHDIKPEQLKYHRRRVAVTKSFTFDAAHHLHLYEGKCKSLHGHTYRLQLTVSGYLNEIGICIDFGDLKTVYQKAIEEPLDHQYLNEVLPPMNTTAENIVGWMWESIEVQLGQPNYMAQSIRLEELTLFETPTSSVTVKREWMI